MKLLYFSRELCLKRNLQWNQTPFFPRSCRKAIVDENVTNLTFIVLQFISSLRDHSALYNSFKVSAILFQEI